MYIPSHLMESDVMVKEVLCSPRGYLLTRASKTSGLYKMGKQTPGHAIPRFSSAYQKSRRKSLNPNWCVSTIYR